MKTFRSIREAACLGALGIAAVFALAGCGAGGVDSGGFTAADRNDAQIAMDAIQKSNISLQIVNLTATAGLVPSTCRVHLESRNPATFKVYVFWIPYIGMQTYTWLNMTITKDPLQDKFHLGFSAPVLPGGILTPGGRSVLPGSADYDTPLALYGPEQAKKNQQVIRAHGGDVFSKPSAKCQVLMEGQLRLVPAP